MLEEIGLAYRPQHLINGKFCVDAFVPSLNLVIQFDGDYWHGNPQKFTALNSTQERAVRYDRAHDAYMARCGYSVMRIWESDFKKRPDAVKSRILRAARP